MEHVDMAEADAHAFAGRSAGQGVRQVLKVYCSHWWGVPIDSEKGFIRMCRWCHVMWVEGDVAPVVQTGYVERS